MSQNYIQDGQSAKQNKGKPQETLSALATVKKIRQTAMLYATHNTAKVGRTSFMSILYQCPKIECSLVLYEPGDHDVRSVVRHSVCCTTKPIAYTCLTDHALPCVISVLGHYTLFNFLCNPFYKCLCQRMLMNLAKSKALMFQLPRGAVVYRQLEDTRNRLSFLKTHRKQFKIHQYSHVAAKTKIAFYCVCVFWASILCFHMHFQLLIDQFLQRNFSLNCQQYLHAELMRLAFVLSIVEAFNK